MQFQNIIKSSLLIGSLIFSSLVYSQQSDFILQARALGLASDGENAFWTTSNTYGRYIDASTAVGDVTGVWGQYLGEDLRLVAGGSAVFRLNQDPYLTEENEETETFLNQYFAGIRWKKLELLGGAWQRPEYLGGISSTNRDILWSNNVRPLPGLVLQTSEPVKLFGPVSFDAAFGNYWMPEDRASRDVMVHYKKLMFHLEIGTGGRLDLGLHHYVQWGGFDKWGYGEQPQSFNDYLKVILGQEGDANASDNDQLNKLGNVIGSYRIGYSQEFNTTNLRFYYQSIAEDETGVDGRNFPDGVWGLSFQSSKGSLLEGMVYEYVQTTWQGGPIGRQGGGDNYFNNGVYRNGWTTGWRVIGIPFITKDPIHLGVINNMVIAHHIGLTGNLGSLEYLLRTSWVENQGKKFDRYPEPENVLYSGLKLAYPSSYGQFSLNLGADLSNINTNRFTVGLGYRYRFTSGCRTGECDDLLQFLQ